MNVTTFKFSSVILTLFTFIGCIMVFSIDFDNQITLILCTLLFVLIPAYGAYGIWHKSRMAVTVMLLFFLFQSVRNLSHDSILLAVAPITISFPFTLPNGQNYLIDIFAITMACLCVVLLKQIVSPSKTA